jgi:hypothetical protein
MRRLATLALALACAHLARATTITLTPSKDNTIYSDDALSNAVGVNLFAGNNGNGATRRALLNFDLSAIPADATITGVTLSLYATVATSVTQTVTLTRLTTDWGEGTSNAGNFGGGGSGAAATTGDATWQYSFYSTTSWTSAGGDFAAGASASTSVASASATYTWNSPGMIADVQTWLADSSTNFGWIVQGNEGANGTAKAFASREAANSTQRPQLTITYTSAVPEPATLALALFPALLLGWNALSQRASLQTAARSAGR